MNPDNSSIRIGPSQLTTEQAGKIHETLTDLIRSRKPFLIPGYTLRSLAEDAQLPLHHISAFINQFYGIHFNEFINRYRVDHFKEKIHREEWKRKKLGAIAEESGFKNRNTFTIAFKKLYGQSPSAYMKAVKQTNL